MRIYSGINIGINIRMNQFSLIFAGSILTGLMGTRRTMLSVGSITFTQRFLKREQKESQWKESTSIKFAIFVKLFFCVSAFEL